ncbi:MAG: hypothetical protein PVI54_04910, partial [Desulfobacteraceae bacterium]
FDRSLLLGGEHPYQEMLSHTPIFQNPQLVSLLHAPLGKAFMVSDFEICIRQSETEIMIGLHCH